MTLQFGLFDYIIIAVFYALAATLLLLGWLWLRRWRIWELMVVPLALAALIAPWADEVWIAWRFGQLCKEAGVHVYRQVETDGYLNATSESPYSDLKPVLVVKPSEVDRFDKEGFRFVEYLLQGGKVWRTERVPEGLWRSMSDHPMARYHYKFADPRQEVPAGFKLEKTEWQVVDSQTGEIIGRETRFSRYPGWIQLLWIRYFGNGGVTCEGSAPQPPTLRHLLYHYVLVPERTGGK